MGAVVLLLQLVAKTFFLGLPVGVAWLAFRRLMRSETVNAWFYAAIGLFAAFSAAGLAPWALGFHPVSWLFLVFAFTCPPLWLATVIFCGIGRTSGYDLIAEDADMPTENPAFYPDIPDQTVDVAPTPAAPLVLEQPIWPTAEATVVARDDKKVEEGAVFRTHRALMREARKTVSERLAVTPEDRSVLDVARGMRGHKDTTRRRMRPLLPSPQAMSTPPNLPFLQR